MLKKTISYEDFNGNKLTEDFYFNLTKAEVAEMEVTSSTLVDGKVTGGMQAMLNDVVASGSGQRIIDVFKEILAKSYGVKSEDGKRFIKTPELFTEFTQTGAYSEFFIELMTEPEAAASFINAIMPVDVPEPIKAKDVLENQYNIKE